MAKLSYNRINYIQRLGDKRERGASASKKMKFVLPIVLIALIILAIEGFLGYKILFEYTPALEELNLYVDNTENIERYRYYSELSAQNGIVLKEYENISNAARAVDSYPQTDLDVFGILNIAENSDIYISSYTYERYNAKFSINCVGESETSAYQFVMRLSETGLFTNIYYNGYGANERRGEEDGEREVSFSFGVTGILSLDGGGTDAETE